MATAKNVLFITADEMRFDAPGFNGNVDCKTPHLDALAKRGTTFKNHFTVHGKCVPSRIAMQTGRYAHTDAIRTVMQDNLLPKGTPIVMEHLKAKGFETAVFGLNHVWDSEWFYGENKKSAGAVDYHSFTEGEIADVNDLEIETPSAPLDGSSGFLEELSEIDYNGCTTGPLKSHSDVHRALQGVKYIKEMRDKSKPFYCQVNLSRPHPPYAIHEPWYSMYKPEELTAYPHDLPENATLHLRKQRELRTGNDISEEALRELQRCYYSAVSFVDDNIGKLIQALDDEDLFKDTLIVFCADHGDFAGQYGINEKWDTAMQDCILHVPFILAGGDIPAGSEVQSLSEHVDIPETILNSLGVAADDEQWGWHGSSLLPLIDGSETRKYVFADGGHEAAMRERLSFEVWSEKDGRRVKNTGGKQLVYKECPDAMARVKMIRSDTWKLAIRECGGNELFNMQEDPQEMRNLYGDPQYNDVVMEL
ncbi:MAG: sulfatase-like hydrolase/transferase, partial [Planctomycetes bacterium]|nr:sulfatase-like hydrolase/transferase [Planctomycetota bacterium]